MRWVHVEDRSAGSLTGASEHILAIKLPSKSLKRRLSFDERLDQQIPALGKGAVDILGAGAHADVDN